ncbi:MAG: long-chain acyl-CoA synthetase, partial [Pseudonocardiales bacterium]|nr:long-chain acyl-CoA synthetase [Pseudonocardiales bacterium]
DNIAVRLDDATLTYALLDGATQHVAGLLAEHGVRPGDRVGIMLPNVPHFALLYYGVLRAGSVVVPMNPLLKEREVAYYLGNSGAKLIFAWQAFADEAEAGAKLAGAEVVVVDPVGFVNVVGSAQAVPGVVDRDDEDTAVILYTSGTTGQPKGAQLTHRNLLRNVEIAVGDLIGVSADDVVFGGLPLFHVFGQTCGLNAAVAVGATLTLLPRFDAKAALDVLVRDGVTVFQGVPTMYVALVNHPDRDDYDLSALRVCVSGGAAMPVEVMTAFEKAFGCVVLEGYGLSETSPAASFNLPDKRRAGSIGIPVSGVEFRLVDDLGADVEPGAVGEIAIRGHNVMKGYWDKPEETANAIRDGWFFTGDMARQDEDGFYFIVDRKKDMIIRGGYNIYPREIEEVLYEHDAVAEAAVIGTPHPELGEEVAAVVALKPGATATAEELRDYVKAKVAAYKYPRHVQIVDALPKGPTGKILKREITVDVDH